MGMGMKNSRGQWQIGCIVASLSWVLVWCGWMETTSVFGQDNTEPDYPLPPEAIRQEGVPEGEVLGPFPMESRIFPGTRRNYWLYVPAQYTPEKAAAVLIVQDGLNRARGWNLPIVMDNLIHAGDMPVTIGVFVDPGVVPPKRDEAQPRFNRSFEYDSLGDRYARFLLEELLPEVAKQYNLSNNPNDRALAGASSGAICAFNAAWERPDAFRRVLSTIGTYVGLRGGNRLAMLVRQTEPKPLRVFLQDGSNDLNIYAGDWWLANQDLLSALKWARYDVHHVWGTGGHNGRHAAAIMPEALRWLWRDWPQEITPADQSDLDRRINVLIHGEGWREVSSGHQQVEAIATNAAGDVFFADAKAERIYQLAADGKTRLFADQVGKINELAFGPANRLLAIRDGKQLVEFGNDGGVQVLFQGERLTALTTLPDLLIVVDSSVPHAISCRYDGSVLGTTALAMPADAICPTADHAFVHLVSSGNQMTRQARLDPTGGTLDALQPYGYLHMPYASQESGAVDVEVDSHGHIYVASLQGIQILDQLGRVNINLLPPSRTPLRAIAFGGADRRTLFATDGARLFARSLNTIGRSSIQPPAVPPRPRL
ncbi:MAG: gluconolactonase [Pirellulaceae bacterium]|nr:MAG: gluconolactonase [Pirellulaceae bacterium]